MKKKTWILLGIAGIIVLILGVFFVVRTIKSLAFIKVETPQVDASGYIFKDYDVYKQKVRSSSKPLTRKDFENNNYVLIVAFPPDSACSNSKLAPVDYKITQNKIEVILKYKPDLIEGKMLACTIKPSYFLLKIDKAITTASVHISYQPSFFF